MFGLIRKQCCEKPSPERERSDDIDHYLEKQKEDNRKEIKLLILGKNIYFYVIYKEFIYIIFPLKERESRENLLLSNNYVLSMEPATPIKRNRALSSSSTKIFSWPCKV